LLAGSVLHQVLNWRQWIGIVENHRLLAPALVLPSVVVLLGAEVLSAALLIVPGTCRTGAIGAAALLCLYALAIGINLARGRTNIDCGCFGSHRGEGIAGWMVVRNGSLAIVASVLWLPFGARPLSLEETMLALGLVTTLGFLYPVLAVVLRGRGHGESAPSRRDESTGVARA
jgi:hypothetical protein